MGTVRPYRQIETYDRGLELIRAIQILWARNQHDRRFISNATTNQRIANLAAEFDLTVAEWHYWCRITRNLERNDNSKG